MKRDAYEFRRDIVVGAENPRTGKTIAEKVLKYMEDKLTQKERPQKASKIARFRCLSVPLSAF